MIKVSLFLAMILLLDGCATVYDSAKYHLSKPVDCLTANEDIAALEAEKASLFKRARCGAQVARPYGAAASVLGGELRDKVQVATGKYNRKIDAKINKIKNQCY